MSATGKILVVDDEERNLRLIEALLAPLGHSILFAPDGPAALRCVAATGPTSCC